MGIYLSAPDTKKHSINGEANGLKYGVSAMQGWRVNMEDAHITDPKFDKNTGLFAVFDGHGGSEVAKFCGNHFGEELKKNENYKIRNYELALKETFLLMDILIQAPDGLEEIEVMKKEAAKNKPPQPHQPVSSMRQQQKPAPKAKEVPKPDPTPKPEGDGEANPEAVEEPKSPEKKEEESTAGCTANVVLIKDGHYYVANAGDSRCVLRQKNCRVIPLSFDHKPEDPQEFARITSAGGYIEEGRINATLNLSRAIGDLEFKKNEDLLPTEQLVSAEPDVLVRKVEKNDDFLCIGCDGIWEIQETGEIMELIENRIRTNKDGKISDAIEEMLDRGLAPDTSLNTGCDNMSCIVVYIKDFKY